MPIVLLLALLTVSERVSSRVVGQTGQSVTLPCKYDISKHGATFVCWGRGEIPLSGCGDLLVSTDGHRVKEETRASSRYQLLGRLDAGDVSLTILNLTETDAGRYGCRVEVPGWFNNEKHVFDVAIERGRITTTTTAQTGRDVIMWRGSDVTGNKPTDLIVTLAQEQQQVNSLQSFIGNTVRFSFITFIPALLLTAAYRGWRCNQRSETDRRLDQSVEGGGSSV
ncbi:LOW QUALITY PROTEIN: hepatitis A virus cellular receptor 1 homolog [Siniperca chuatsi]|uniref:LOW QUALITY PROTEIN: hepatitis A virus cellular receptor 1 homolog n=1 Tax=Siniperca chuatsi TaxID=119488 RepID=UPI001CE19042|nr:LOW QUALITY PROTEIN: hepatitis A virus cellular receptor 1 homolog [Siniperca chuatsi]